MLSGAHFAPTAQAEPQAKSKEPLSPRLEEKVYLKNLILRTEY
jgi:hypothetical protein